MITDLTQEMHVYDKISNKLDEARDIDIKSNNIYMYHFLESLTEILTDLTVKVQNLEKQLNKND